MTTSSIPTSARFCTLLATILAATLLRPAAAVAVDDSLTPLVLPGGEGGIGFDDLGFSRALAKVLVPAGRTGNLDLIDPETRQIVSIGGFATSPAAGGGHGEGITSVDEGRGLLFVTDRTARRLEVVDPNSKSVIAFAPLAAGPDYVRFVADTNQVWVTEPRAQRIEVFSLPASGTPQPLQAGFIEVPGGPEALIVDHSHNRAFTHLWKGTTVAIRLTGHEISQRWPNGCAGSRGIAIDEKRGFLFVGCDEGKVNVLDLGTGKLLGSAASGSGVDIIAYDEKLAHLYLPGGDSATMAIVGISGAGGASVVKTVKTAADAHCVTADDHDQAYICDPAKGGLLIFRDSLPATK